MYLSRRRRLLHTESSTDDERDIGLRGERPVFGIESSVREFVSLCSRLHSKTHTPQLQLVAAATRRANG